MQLIFSLPVENSSFSFKLPPDFYPNYKKMGAPDPVGYKFEVDLSIKSSKKITQISAPEGAVSTRDEEGTTATIKCTVPSDDFRVFYRSSEMKYPHLVYAESPEYPGEVAVCASLVPTFEPPQPQEELEVLEDQEPESSVLSEGNNYLFIFIVDRSYSMSGARIRTCKAALKLFIQSLPVGSKFSIISFGSNDRCMTIDGKQVIEYNDATSKQALQQIDTFDADMGGTEILSPLRRAQVMEVPGYRDYNQWLHEMERGEGHPLPMKHVQKRIFLLTDGQVGNADYVINQAKFANDAIRTHTFGIGQGCDEKMVIDVAKAGRGSHSIILDDSNQLNSKVITALARAFEPSLKGCKLIFGDSKEELNEVFRNQTLYRSALMTKAEFEKMRFEFSSQLDPVTNEPLSLMFDSSEFRRIQDKSFA